MSVKKCDRFIRLVILSGLQALSTAPSFAVDPEVVAKKMLCHKCLKDIYVSRRMTTEATAEFQAMLALSPGDARTHFEYGNFLASNQKTALAFQQYQQAVRLKPAVAEYQAGLGNGCMYSKKYDMAVSAYTRACQLGGRYDKQLQLAQQYSAQNKQIQQYEKKQQQERDDEE